MSISEPHEKRQQGGACISADVYATLSIDPRTRQGFAYQRVAELIGRYSCDTRRALDYGCGAGRSTRFLRQLGINEVLGVDIDENMLHKAVEQKLQGVSYRLIQSGIIPVENGEFDLSFSGMVLLEIPDEQELRRVITEMKRVTDDRGKIVILTATKEGYTTDSALFRCLLDAEEKNQLKDGDPVLTLATANNQQFSDYYWSDELLKRLFKEAGLQVVDESAPVASVAQISTSKELTDRACYIIYVCEKVKC